MSKSFFFDIDGTLIACEKGINEIPQSTQNAMNQLKKNKHHVFLATGRCPCFILDSVNNYSFDGMVCCNGALAIFNNKIMYKSVISSKAIEAVISFAKKFDCVAYFESVEQIYAVNTHHFIHDAFINGWGMKKETIVTNFDPKNIETYIGMIGLKDESEAKVLYDCLSIYFDIQPHNSGISFDLTLKGESKAKGIEQLLKAMDSSLNDAIAFGDGNNDIEMLETVGLSIAMGNAQQKAKDVANYITENIEDDGIVKALSHFDFI